MQTILVMVKCELGQSYPVAEEIAEQGIASDIFSISGQYDLFLKCYLDNDVDIGRFVTERIQMLPGVKDTFTIITFKAFT